MKGRARDSVLWRLYGEGASGGFKRSQPARLVLRPFTLADAPEVQRLAGDRYIAPTTRNISHRYEDGMAEQWIETHKEKFEAGELVNFAISLRWDNSLILIGAIGLRLN